MVTVILAAGIGSRLGLAHPKPLTQLDSGESILERQIRSIRSAFGANSEICIVVGFKKDMVMETFPDVTFVYNERYAITNTSQSLLRALQATGDQPVLWLNGDVVLEPAVLEYLKPRVEAEETFVAVNRSPVGDEEVKYTVDEDGAIEKISKVVEEPLGEALGINFVSATDKPALVAGLAECDDDDYFERGIEIAIDTAGLAVAACDISDLVCHEVDSLVDLNRANELLASTDDAAEVDGEPRPVDDATTGR